MTYPKHMFRAGGAFRRLGKQYSVAGAANADEEKTLKAQGWNADWETAVGLGKEKAQEKADETAPPTRTELEAKAEELGIGFTHRTKDETLLRKIEEAL